MSRIILLVASIIAIGQAKQAQAVVVTGWTSAVLAFDLPSVPAEYSVWGSEGVAISCISEPCGSVLHWWNVDPDDPLQPDPDERTAPPTDIFAKVGSGPELDDLGIFYGFGGNYADTRGAFLTPVAATSIIVPKTVNTVYLTFLLGRDPDIASTGDAFYVLDKAILDFRWGDGDGSWLDLADVTGRPYVPVSQVPLPASLLLIIASVGATAALGARKKVATRA